MGLHDHLSKITDSLNDIGSKPAKQRHGSIPAPSSLSYFSDELRETNEEMKELKKKAGQAIRIRMDLCDDGPYHAGALEQKRVQNLKANLKENGQSAPALLRVKEGGRYEIVAGRHRKAALLELGNSEWDAVIKDIDEDTAERLTFYDNLLAPSLNDYAKYLGFAKRRESKGFTLDQLAHESGVSRSTISRLLAFGNLPKEAIPEIDKAPEKITGLLAEQLSSLSTTHGARVTEAVGLVVKGSLAPSKASAWVLDHNSAMKQKPLETVIKKGKSAYAKVVRRGEQVSIVFANSLDADEAEKLLIEFLTQRGKELKKV